MLITRIHPTVPELVARALTDTAFLTQITAARPSLIAAFAEISASLAAEHWEAERHTLIGLTLPPELIADVAQALVAHADELSRVREAELYATHGKVERALAALALARTAINFPLPLAAAERMMDDTEHNLDLVRISLTRAQGILQSAIAQIEARGAV